MDVADHYRSQREAVTALALSLTPDQLELRVPACPEWNVRDVLAHLSALPADVLAGRMEGAPGSSWTQRQVDEAVRALDWTGDPEPWIPVLPLFRPGR